MHCASAQRGIYLQRKVLLDSRHAVELYNMQRCPIEKL